MKMLNTIKYKGYVGTVEFSEEDEILFGKVIGVHANISYDGKDVASLIKCFHNMVDEYLSMCETKGVVPETCFKGSFNVRISPELHEKVARLAMSKNITLNKIVEEALLKVVE